MTSAKLIKDRLLPKVYDAEQPWQRQPCDHDAAWAAFRVYLTAPIPRSLAWLAKRVGVHDIELKEWSTSCYWAARANAFDNFAHRHFQEHVITVLEENAGDYVARHTKLLEQASELAANELQKFLDASLRTPGMTTITARELISLMSETIKLERLIRGESTDNVKQEIDLTSLTPDDLIYLKALQEKVGIR